MRTFFLFFFFLFLSQLKHVYGCPKISKTKSSSLTPQAWVEKSVNQLSLASRAGGTITNKVTIDDLATRKPSSKKPAVLTSPRSIKVCLEHGIDPAMLVPKAQSDFATPGLSQEHQRLKWEHYETIRLERVEVLNEARDEMDLEEGALDSAVRVPGVAGATGRGIDGSYLQPELSRNYSYDGAAVGRGGGRADALKASAVKEEERRLEAVRRRAEKQITAMELARERLEQRQELMEEKVRWAAALERERAKEKAARERERQREVYERSQAKKAEEARLLRQQQRDMEKRFKENDDNRRRKEEQEKAERVAKQRAEKEKAKKLTEFKQQTDAILNAQQAAILRKKEVMERRDAARQAFIEEERAETAVLNERKRLEFNRRREEAKARGEGALEFRRRIIMEKAAEVHHRQMTRAEDDEARRQLRAAQNAAKSVYQTEVYSEAQTAQKQKIDLLIEREKREEHRVKVIAERKKREAAMKSLQKSMSVDERREKVECMKRYKEYQNAQLLEKIERDTAKAKAVLAAKEELRKNRRETNRLLSLQREKLKQDMDRRAARSASSRGRRMSGGGGGGGGGGAAAGSGLGGGGGVRREGSAPPTRPRSAMR